MQMTNTKNHYGRVSILLHWIMAIIIIGLLILGLYMVRLPISMNKLKFYGWHKEYGMLILLLVILRLAWRFLNSIPSLSMLATWERITARSVHGLFYILMFAMPLTGWLITSAANLPISFFGIIVFPSLISPNQQTMALFQQIHAYLAYVFMALIGLHSGAALKHHFINKDDILRRML